MESKTEVEEQSKKQPRNDILSHFEELKEESIKSSLNLYPQYWIKIRLILELCQPLMKNERLRRLL